MSLLPLQILEIFIHSQMQLLSNQVFFLFVEQTFTPYDA